jgi:hypothetical protein
MCKFHFFLEIFASKNQNKLKNARCLFLPFFLHSLQNEGENMAKLERAAILELTVKHIHTLRQQNKMHVRLLTESFRAGFSHCATKLTKFLNNVEQNAGLRVVQHLNDCVRRLDTTTITYQMNPPNAVDEDLKVKQQMLNQR